MVLEVRLSYFAICLIFFLSASCNASGDSVSDKTKILNYSLVLKSTGNSCLLDSNYKGMNKTYNLKIKPPCYFIRQENHKLQYFGYNDININAVVLVLGNPVSDKKRRKWNLEKNMVCGESRQAIIIKPSGLIISEKILQGGLSCKDHGADEKDFWYFAH